MNLRLIKIIDAICEVYDMKEFKPDGKYTYCNYAVQAFLKKIGYNKMAGLTANKMCDYMELSEEWEKLRPIQNDNFFTLQNIWDAINDGEIIIAGLQMIPHGHVVVCRAGLPVQSGKWQLAVPKCLDIGVHASISQGINFAFREIPQFYRLKI